jgi:hypothetical protein
MNIRSPRLPLGEFVFNDAKIVLQQYRSKAEVTMGLRDVRS